MPSLLRPAAALLPDSLSYLGIAIKRIDKSQYHVAFVYCLDGKAPRVSHLCWHCDWRDEPWGRRQKGYSWTSVEGLDEIERKVVAAYLDAVQTPPQIPYGFSRSGCRFVLDPGTGRVRFVPSTPGKGLTCATFIVMFFAELSFPMLREEEWPQRPEDLKWQQHVLRLLKAHSKAGHEELNGIRADLGAIRVRPAEVAAAATVTTWPVGFQEASQLAEQIIREVASAKLP